MKSWLAPYALLIALAASPAHAFTSEEARAKRPDLFHAETGFRIARQRAPTPDDIPGPARRIEASAVKALENAILIDVSAAAQSRYDELDGRWMLSKPRLSLPGAVWLPEIGRGTLDAAMTHYMSDNLARLSDGDCARPLVFFCIADCWMSWNAAQRAAQLGYKDVRWLREGSDGWLDIGGALDPIEPVPVRVD